MLPLTVQTMCQEKKKKEKCIYLRKEGRNRHFPLYNQNMDHFDARGRLEKRCKAKQAQHVTGQGTAFYRLLRIDKLKSTVNFG